MPATTKRRDQKGGKSRAAVSTRFREDHLQAVRALLAPDRDVREGHMFGYPAFFVARRMFACVYGDGVGIKVPLKLAAHLIERGVAIAFRPHGKPAMREWVQINRSCSNDYSADLEVLLAAKRFVCAGRDGGAQA